MARALAEPHQNQFHPQHPCPDPDEWEFPDPDECECPDPEDDSRTPDSSLAWSKSMPQIEHLPGRGILIVGCIGQTHSSATAGTRSGGGYMSDAVAPVTPTGE